ncbi:type VI secretion system-associated FHA domain protein TagH [Pseudomonas bohemica]|uniref:type VI secretion system-associated FHA domain protein TagH n=1 Tax=Pseudomonas bohemica TaxID=2044872 RepID=UPI000DA6149B|nr:type VI secretion system-associated FHA domain protein TagH [Pseudomonas bohemica]
MSLCLTITSYHKITPGQIPEKSMDNGVMAIGRSQENDWILPDPERLVSSRHCVIQYKDGRYYLTDNSTNGVELVNAGIRLRRGNSEPLEDGELIRIGDYEIRARIDFEMKLPGADLTGADSSNSFDALMGRQNSAASMPVEAVPAAHFQGGTAQDTFPDLFDFLTPPRVPPAAVSDHVPAERHDFRPPAPQAPPASILQPSPVSPAGVIPEDWDVFADMPKSSAPSPIVPPVPVPAPVAQAKPVAITPPPKIVEPNPPAAGSGEADLLKAFLRGAGLDQLRIESAQVQAQMEAIGRSYRLMVEGLIDVLRARTSLKGEFRMQQTMIRPVENNPLKFAPNTDEALLLLLRHGNPAFMPPDQAIADSFDDLRAHQMAVMAGVEAAIKALLKRFEPAQLEARMGKPGALSNLFGSRQAQHWQQFTELYTQISREAEEDFQVLFGREFSRAYEEHSARLRRP